MLLLRNKFFKTCGFKSKIQKWFLDNDIKDTNQLKQLGHITFAKDINQIVMITTRNSLKYIKFVDGFNEKNIASWLSHIDEYFGVVKYDKGTRYYIYSKDSENDIYQLCVCEGNKSDIVIEARKEELPKG